MLEHVFLIYVILANNLENSAWDEWMETHSGFKACLEAYRLERRYGTLKQNREALVSALKAALCKKCGNDFPNLRYHALWRLHDGSLGIVIRKGEINDMDGKPFHFMACYRENAILLEAARNNVWIAPVSSHMELPDNLGVSIVDGFGPVSSRLMRHLRHIYRIYFNNELFYGYPKNERRISVDQLVKYLGCPKVERWQFSTRPCSRPPVDLR